LAALLSFAGRLHAEVQLIDPETLAWRPRALRLRQARV